MAERVPEMVAANETGAAEGMKADVEMTGLGDVEMTGCGDAELTDLRKALTQLRSTAEQRSSPNEHRSYSSTTILSFGTFTL